MSSVPSAVKRPLLKRRSVRIGLVVLVLLIGAVWLLRPEPLPPARGSGEPMRAIVYHEYGSPDVLRFQEVEKPLPNPNQVLVRVRAAAANPYDWHFVRGTPYIMRMDSGWGRPKDPRVGVDFAGVVVAVGEQVRTLEPGDEVFGSGAGAFAQYVRVSEKRVVRKPANLTFEQAASVPVAALTALQGLRDAGALKPGEKVLINGASGGVGTFAVQIAKALGAEVTGVCSTRNVELVRSLGADHVIDYTTEDVTRVAQRYDLILDNVGNHSVGAFRRVLKPGGRYVLIGGGGPHDNKVLGPLGRVAAMFVVDPFVSQKLGMMISANRQEDLLYLSELLESGKVKPIIDRTYPLERTSEALRYLESGRARGKVIIKVDESIAS